MALRVLLADESATIKKVFQLSLQDYAAEVTSVNVGLDVLSVAAKIKPDIIFIDVLLQKRNGYEVCTDLKKDPTLKGVPVVLIWSGFMELDQKRFKACGANAELEKPFDTDKLRGLIQKMVPKTNNQAISSFLNFPKMPEFEEPKRPSPSPLGNADLDQDLDHQTFSAPLPPPISETETYSGPTPLRMANQRPPIEPDNSADEDWSMENFAPLKAPMTEATGFTTIGKERPAEDEDAEWVAKTLTQYKMDKKKLLEDPEVHFEVPDDKIDAEAIMRRPQKRQRDNEDAPPDLPMETDSVDEDDEIELELSSPADDKVAEPAPTISALSEKQIEGLIRAEARAMIEKVVWEIVPEIATQIIEREIKRILKENDESTP